LAVYVNGDDALLLWTADELDDRCTGFAIRRELKRNGNTQEGWVDNFARFGPADHQDGNYLPSDRYPFRCLSWTDHEVEPGDEVRYRALPVLEGEPAPSQDLASEWSERRILDASAGAPFGAYFNRGYVISQFMSRYLDEHYPGVDRDTALHRFKDDIHKDVEDEVRVFLSGQIRTTMLSLLADLASGDGHLYAAIFELDDTELVKGLKALGARAHLVLANGSVQHKTGASTAEERRTGDENKEARGELLDANVDVSEHDRFVSPGALAHNKFAVVTDSNDNPLRVWTGSTNWTTTGLCTQLNNGLLVDDSDVAKAYLEQWKALRGAKSDHPPSLASANVHPATIDKDAGDRAVHAEVHFTRADDEVDLVALKAIVTGAQQGVLFLMFMPGDAGVLSYVRELAAQKPDLLVRGVVSELPKGRADEKTGDTTTLEVSLVGSADPAPQTFEVVQPEGMDHPAAGWAAETTHRQFQGSIGHAIIHSKVLVIDPFTKPVVITGSHNFSAPASNANDENLLIVKGNKALAERYAVNIMSVYQHYRWRAYVRQSMAEHKSPWEHLTKSADWQKKQPEHDRELAFWVR
jgi:hypothetical protein